MVVLNGLSLEQKLLVILSITKMIAGFVMDRFILFFSGADHTLSNLSHNLRESKVTVMAKKQNKLLGQLIVGLQV
jgi:hypothetical protein